MEQNTKRTTPKKRRVTRKQLQRRRLLGLLALLLILFLLSLCCSSCVRCVCGVNPSSSGQSPTETTNAEMKKTTPAPTEPTTVPVEYLVSTLPQSHQITIDFISQYPELPTGSEVTSLTMVLKSLGFDVTKQILANNFLTCADAGMATFSQAYIGSPFDDSGMGCFAPVIVDAAQKYLKSQNSARTVKSLNADNFEDILLRVASNHPVIVWINQDLELMQEEYCFTVSSYAEPPTTAPAVVNVGESNTTTETAAPEITTTQEETKQDVYWIPNATCVVLTGYDLENKTVTVLDPAQGEVTYDMEMFKTSYNALYKQAVLIY